MSKEVVVGELIKLLEKLDENFEPSAPNGFYTPTGSGYDEDLEDLVIEIQHIACYHIISDGKVNYGTIELLKEMSTGKYDVLPGETDSFGWLSGVITTTKGKVVFG